MAQGLLNVPGEYAFDDRIHYWASQYGIPFALAKGLVSVESRFDPKAYRAEPQIQDGSRGLTQILLKTAKEVGFTGSGDDLFEPDRNLSFGLKFLSKLLQNPGYSVTDAVATYNMGSPRKAADTTAWIVNIYGQPKPDWMYANEPYVRRVLMNAAYYLAQEQNNTGALAAISAIVKKKLLPIPPSTWSWTLTSINGRREIQSATFDSLRLCQIAREVGAIS